MIRLLSLALLLLMLAPFHGHADPAKNKTEAVHWGKKQEKLMETFAFDAPRQTLTIPRAAQPPVIDGEATDACWQNASVIDTLTATKGLDTKPPQRFGIDATIARNEVRVTYDDQYLYVHFTCWEHLTPMLEKKVTERDGQVWKDDSLELFFDTNRDRQTEYHVIINPAGAVYDASEQGVGKAKGDKTFNFEGVQTAVTILPDRWTMEARFDFASIGGAPKPGDAWGMDFCRQRRAANIEGINTYGTWSGSPYAFSGRPDIRGDVTFGDLGIWADQLPRPFLGQNSLGCKILAPATDRTLTAEVSVVNEFGERQTSAPVTVTAKAGTTTDIRVPFAVATEGVHFATLTVRDGETTLLNARRGFVVETVQREIDAIMPGLERLKSKADNPDFIASMNAYLETVTALQAEVAALRQELLAAPAVEANRARWDALAERVRSVSSRTTYMVWTKNPYLQTGEGDFPSSLKDVESLQLRTAVNEWEVASLMVTNFGADYLNLIVRGTERVPGLVEIRSPLMTSMATVVEENPKALDFDTVRGFNLPEATGEPLERLGSFNEIVVPPFGTRQLLLIFHTADLRPKTYNGKLLLYPLNSSHAPKEVGIELTVDKFELPTVADLGVHVYNYGGSDAEIADMQAHKVNTWFLDDIGKLSLVDGKVVHTTDGMAARWKRFLDMPGARKGWAYGIVNGYLKWAKTQKALPYMGPAYREGFAGVVRDMVAVGAELGLKPSEIRICAWDEVKGSDIDITVEHLKIVREVAPELKIVVTAQIDGADRDKLTGYIDIWSPAGGYVWGSGRLVSQGWKTEATSFYDFRKDEGCVIWPYVCTVPVRGQDTIGYYRMAGWRAFDAQTDGIAVFAWSYLVYRFNGEAIPTRGWEALRQGVEDWQYCHLAQQHIERLEAAGKTDVAAAARAEMVAILKDVMQYGTHPRGIPEAAVTIETARTRVADLILSLQKEK